MEQKEDKIQWGQTQNSFVSEQTTEYIDNPRQILEIEYTASSMEEAVISIEGNNREFFLKENKENLEVKNNFLNEMEINVEDTKKQDSTWLENVAKEEIASTRVLNSNRKLFTMHKPVASDEDAPPISENGIIIVCDGLGAAGQNRHQYGEKTRTSAYIGSRCVSKAAYEFFNKPEVLSCWSYNEETTKQVMIDFKEYLSNSLENCIKDNQLQKIIKGKSSELLPTTLAMAIYKENLEQDIIEVLTIWAGDSRVYLLSPDHGLQQISVDDTSETYDAMKALGISNMCNSISGEGKDTFSLNYNFYKVVKRQNLFLFAATDGCFDYLPTPMYFEGVLESAIGRMPDSADPSQYGDCLGAFYQGNYLNDDTTIAGVIFNPSDIVTLKKDYAKRYEKVEKLYNNPTIEHMKKKMIAEEEAGKRLTPVNKKMKMVGNDLRSEVIAVLNTEYPENTDGFQFRDRLLRFPCMVEYAKKEFGSRKEIKELEQTIALKEKEKNSQQLELEKLFDSIFMEQYIQQWRNTKKTSIWRSEKETELDKLVRQYDSYREDLEKKIKVVENSCIDLRELLDRRLYSLDGRDQDKLLNWAKDIYDKATEILTHVNEEDKARKEISVNEKTTRGKIYQEVIKRKANDEKFGGEYWNKFYHMCMSKFRGYEKHEDYTKLVNLSKNIELLEKEITKYKQEKKKKKIEIEYEPVVRSLGNTLVIDFIKDSECFAYLSDDLRDELVALKKLYEEQNMYKKEAEEEYQKIFALWQVEYKFFYEFYQNPIFGGTV